MKAQKGEGGAVVSWQWRRSDLWWLLATPVYLLLGTLRHEASHALATIMAGGRVGTLVFWPTYHANGGLYWGYVRLAWPWQIIWPMYAAPYVCDVGTYAIAFALWWAWPRAPRWLRLNLAVFGLVSPFVNTLANYVGAVRGRVNDVSQLMAALPAWVVHTAFLGVCLLYAAGLVWTLWPRALRRRALAAAPSD